MTPQEIFDKVVVHLYTQKKRSVASLNRCVYRAPDGSKCAVGALFSDDEYFREMDSDGGAIERVRAMYGSRLPEWVLPNVQLLADLQAVHDLPNNWEKPGRLRAHLHSVATYRGLSTAVLDQQEEFVR